MFLIPLHQQVRMDFNINNPVQAAGAARGMKTLPFLLNAVGVQLLTELWEERDVFPPRAALRLHGVIHIKRLRRYGNAINCIIVIIMSLGKCIRHNFLGC